MQSSKFLGAASALVLAFGFASNKAHAVGAPAGTVINNTAEVNYTVGSREHHGDLQSPSSVTVAEILDVVVTRRPPHGRGELPATRSRKSALPRRRTPATVPRPSAWS